MAGITTIYDPPHITETDEPAPWTDCTVCSVLMAVLVGTRGSIPAHVLGTSWRPEREALRKATGDLVGGASIPDMAIGVQARYHLTMSAPAKGLSGDATSSLLRYEGAVVWQGLYRLLTVHYRRWDSGFGGGHAMVSVGYWAKHPVTGELGPWTWLHDPLGRGTAYHGEYIKIMALRAFAKGLMLSNGNYSAWGVLPGGLMTEGDPMLKLDVQRHTVAAGTPWFSGPRGTQMGKIAANAQLTALGHPVIGNKVDAAWTYGIVRSSAGDGILGWKLGWFRAVDLKPGTPVPPAGWGAALIQALRTPTLPGTSAPSEAQLTAARVAGANTVIDQIVVILRSTVDNILRLKK